MTEGAASPLLRIAAGAADDLLALLLPRVCAACSAAPAGLRAAVCDACWVRTVPLPEPRCARCGHPRLRDSCAWCRLLPPHVRAARSVCWTERGSVSGILRALKYDGWHSVATGMAARMARLEWPEDVVEERRAVVPVPLAAARLRERGYNQSERLAASLAQHWSCELWTDCLQRRRATESQTRLTPGERRRNVSGAFHAAAGTHSPSQALRGSHLVLVDDVITTAATLNACAAALMDAGARIVSYVTFARAPAPGD